ncbi:hypothetical protein Tco_1175859 [Tanacetum coccineum]
MLKVSPWKEVIRFGKRGKLNPRYIGPFKPLAILLDEIHIDDKLHFVEELVEIMDYEVKRLKQSCIPIIKVRWNSRRGPEFTWERLESKVMEGNVVLLFMRGCMAKRFNCGAESAVNVNLWVRWEIEDVRQLVVKWKYP